MNRVVGQTAPNAGAKQLEQFSASLANDIFNLFSQTGDSDNTIEMLLEKTGEMLCATRVVVLELRAGSTVPTPIYTWSACGEVVFEDSFVGTLWHEGQECAESLHADGSDFRHFNTGAGIQCYFFKDGKPLGSIYVEDTQGSREWLVQEKLALEAVAKVFCVYLAHMRQLRHMELERVLADVIEEKGGFYSYILKENSFEILYLDKRTAEAQPQARPGDICYQVFLNRSEPCEECPLSLEPGCKVERFNTKMNCWLTISTKKIDLGEGKYGTLVLNADISDFKRRIKDADEQTGLPTFFAFKEKLLPIIARDKQKRAMIYLNFEKFSEINEKRGMETGTEVLNKFSEFLLTLLKPDDFICRYFSDVFLIYAEYVSVEELKQRVQDCYDVLEKWNEQCFPGIKLTVKSGVYPIENKEESLQSIVAHAGIACCSIEKGGNFAIFSKTMQRKLDEEKKIEKKMAEALRRNEFTVYIQPKVDFLNTNKVLGGEALIRWRNKSGNMMPSEFIPLFEKNGFIEKMDYYMNEQVFKIVRKWLDKGVKTVPISVNISDENIKDKYFVERLKALIEKYEIPPYTIEIELRESMFDGDREALSQSINDLRRQGFMFSINDFGKGPSSLSFIKNLPIDVFKLDRSMFDSKYLSEKERSVLMHMVRMAKSLDMQVLCEGIEDEEQADVFRNAGCDMAQGFLYGGPITAAAFERRMSV